LVPRIAKSNSMSMEMISTFPTPLILMMSDSMAIFMPSLRAIMRSGRSTRASLIILSAPMSYPVGNKSNIEKNTIMKSNTFQLDVI